MRTPIIILFLLIGIASVLYLSWVADPLLGSIWFIPDWLAAWADAGENDTLRTGVPFVFIGMAVGVWLYKRAPSRFHWLMAWAGLCSLVVVAEIGQLGLPRRSFDWYDILWGAAGAALGLLGGTLISSISKAFKKQ